MGGRGAGSGGGGLAGRTPKQDKELKKIAKRTANLKKEQYRIVDDQGNVVLMKKGNQDQVTLTVGEKRQYMDGNISIHNHPDGGTFSPVDIRDFGFGAKEITVSSPEGTYRLINKKVGTKDQYKGWQGLVDGAEKIPQQSFTKLRKQAEQNLANSKAQKGLNEITNKWDSIRKSKGTDEANKYFNSVKDKFDDLTQKRKAEVQKETRRLEVKPFHDYYKANAKKHGFEYRFEKKK